MNASHERRRKDHHKPHRGRSRSFSPRRKSKRDRSPLSPRRKPKQREHSSTQSPRRVSRPRDRSRERQRDRSPPRRRDDVNVPDSHVTSEPRLEQGPTENPAPDHRNLKTSGLLQEEYSTYKGVVIKYNEPPEACKPTVRWRMYVFKPGCEPEKLYIHRQSAYLISRDRKIADIPFDHPSISKQHAVLQYRKAGGVVKPYLMDLESSNCTYLNGKRLEPRRFYEVLEKDVVKFGYSSRECVFLSENAL